MPSALPYRVATLIYIFDREDRALLIRRAREPNRGLWSPPGGKLKVDIGESPHMCAARETREETGLALAPADFHLTGLIGERAYQGQTHWLMFLFEARVRLDRTPPPHKEGPFAFVAREALGDRPLPDSDRRWVWPAFWAHRGGFFSAYLEYDENGEGRWIFITAAFIWLRGPDLN